MKTYFRVVLTFAVTLLVTGLPSLAQEKVVKNSPPSALEFFYLLAQQWQDPISFNGNYEHPAIMGKTTLRSIKYQLQRNEIVLYRLFNELNSADELDINCERGGIDEEGFLSVNCEPAFVDQLREDGTNKYETIEKEIAELASKHPQFLAQLRIVERLQAEYGEMATSSISTRERLPYMFPSNRRNGYIR